MGQLVFQAALGGQVNLVGPNTASTFNLNVPAASDTLVARATTDTLTNKTLTSPVISGGTIDNAVIGGTTAVAGSFTTLSASSTVSGTGFSTYLASPPAIGGTTAAAGTFTTLTANTSVTTPFVTSAAATNLLLKSAGTTAVTIDTSQNVGIGTASPSTKLDVQNNGDVTARSYSTNASNQAFVQAVNSAGTYIGLLQYGASKTAYGALPSGGGALYSTQNITLMADTSTGYINFATGGNTERMRLDASGNLGVGTTTPNAVGSNWKGLSVGVAGIQGGSSGSFGSNLQHNAYYNGSSWIRVQTGGTAHMEFDGTGFKWFSDGSGSAGSFTPTERARIDSSGNLLVGTTSSSNPVGGFIAAANYSTIGSYTKIGHISGAASGSTYMEYYYNGSAIGSITQSGTTGVLYNLTSDYRLKNDQQALTGAKDFIMALKPKKWQWWDGSGEGVGFVAHEFMEVAKYSGQGEKDAVDEDGKPIYQSIQPSSSEVMANLVAFIQEQNQLIQSLTDRITTLEAK